MSQSAPSLDRLSPDANFPLGASSVSMSISESLVARFAELTGDHSQLHVDDTMARRTAYRRRVVHGMLPVGFLAASRPFQVDGYVCVPVALTGRFLAPVYAGDQLTFATAALRAVGDRHYALAFRIENAASGAVVTVGEATVEYVARPSHSDGGIGEISAMLSQPVAMSQARLEDIDVGAKESFEFAITHQTLRQFCDILRDGLSDEASAPREEYVDLTRLLPILLFSTSVGVSLPGANATFLEFSARLEASAILGRRYVLEGEVVHRSRGTRIIKKQIVVRGSQHPDEVVLHGKVAALVNKPAARMPSIDELRESAVDLGLEGKVVLITGASRGIGETTAKLFALHGAKVIVNYHRGTDDARRVVGEIVGAGGSAIAVAADVSREGEVRALVERTTEAFGTVDVLVNSAVRDFRPIPFSELTWDEVQKDIDVIAKGAFLCCRQVVPAMLAQGGGKIINVVSVATDNPPVDQTKYVIAKSALVGLTRSLSIELAAQNIQVNMVAPSFVETDLVAHVQEGFRNKIARETPMGRNASSVDVARAVLFLASSFASFTTGQKIMVTGGGAPYL